MASMAMGAAFAAAEMIAVCISRLVEDGEVVAQGIATPMVAAGYLLAKRTHAPGVIVLSAIGNSICNTTGKLGLTRSEDLWVGQALFLFDFAEAACEILPSRCPKEFFRPAQVDRRGRFNNVILGGQRRLRLPGCGGIADLSPYHPRAYLYVPRHERSVFVERLDFVSGVGAAVEGRPGDGPGPRLLISNLGVFDFEGASLRLVSRHPGVTVAEIEARTGFRVDRAPELQETEPPSAEELRLLREEIDPLGIRELEGLRGADRRQRIREICREERERAGSDRAPARDVVTIDHGENKEVSA